MVLRTFRWSFIVTIASLVIAFLYGGIEALVLCTILGILEVSLSFDNAVVNAKILQRMSEFWQKIFLTIGILIAVFGMRLVFPLLIVGITADLGPIEAVELALEKGDPEEPGTYGFLLEEANPLIASFGGMFLLMLFLDWIFEDRDVRWLTWLERPLAKMGRLDSLSVVVATVILVVAAQYLGTEEVRGSIMVSGALGLITYLTVNSLGTYFETAGQGITEDDEDAKLGIGGDREAVQSAVAATGGPATVAEKAGLEVPDENRGGGQSQLVRATGKAGFFLFLYLEVLDASFSFDGVIGAFAITNDPIIIALGLGFIGAMYVRSITVYLVRKGTLSEYVYLEHGAHWAIGALALILIASIKFHVPEIITGLIGVVFILSAVVASVLRNRREAAAEERETAGV